MSADKEEKTQLQAILSGFDSKISASQKEQEDLYADASKELTSLNAQISSLETQKANWVFFAGKQKKEIQTRIDSLKATLPNIEEKANRAKVPSG